MPGLRGVDEMLAKDWSNIYISSYTRKSLLKIVENNWHRNRMFRFDIFGIHRTWSEGWLSLDMVTQAAASTIFV